MSLRSNAVGSGRCGETPRREQAVSRLLAAAAICAACALRSAASARPRTAARGFETGLYDGDFTSTTRRRRRWRIDRSAQARAGFVLVYVDWSVVAPYNRPVGFVPSNPADPNYDWAAVDAAVRDAHGARAEGPDGGHEGAGLGRGPGPAFRD